MKRKATRSAPRHRKKTTNKGIKHRTKRRVKVNKKKLARRARSAVKKIVKDVLQCSENIGIYNKCYVGEIEPLVGNGQRNVAYGMTRQQANAGAYTSTSMRFSPCTILRVVDSVSTLFNNKAAGIDIEATGNFTFDELKLLKVEILYASYKMEVYNYTLIPYEMEILEVTNKSTMADDFMLTADSLLDNSGFRVAGGGIPTFATGGQPQQWYIDGELDWGMIKGISQRYTIKKLKSKVLYPGKKMTYFHKTMGCYEFKDKLFTISGVVDIAPYVKGEKQILISYKPVFHLEYNGTVNIGTSANLTADLKRGFVVKVSETWKINEPDGTLDANSGDRRVYLNDQPLLTDRVGVVLTTGHELVTVDPVTG